MHHPDHHLDTEILIVGAGAAGVAAAVVAARAGADVLLVEKNGFAGGMATSAYVGTVCGLYFRNTQDQFVPAVNGFTQWFCDTLGERSGTTAVAGRDGLKFLPYDRLAFMRICDDVLLDAGVNVLYHSTLNQVHVTDNKISGAHIILADREVGINAKVVIDTSGFAIVGNFIPGIELISGNDYQAGAQVFGISHIEAEDERQLNLLLIKIIKDGIAAGELEDDRSWLSVVPGSFKGDSAVLKLSVPFSLHDSPDALSRAEAYARRKIEQFISILKKHNAFSNIQLSMIAPAVGMRTGPRYEGKYVLTDDDVLRARKFEDSAARGTWPIEYWKPGEQVEMTYFAEDDFYDIPKTCLTSPQIANLFFAGRHISATEQAIASARVIGTCMSMGETAGQMAVEYLNQSS